MTCDSLTNDKIEIFVKDGRGLEASYSESSYYFTATLSRVFPVSNFHLIWTHLGKKMDIDITLDAFCGQGGHSPNSFWIDKIEFKQGKYTADKNNGLEICCIGYEVHANFTDVNKLKKSDDITDSYYNNYSDRILKINCH
ncbi:hypothetical protein [Flavobacterium sp. GCM10023249]|uniref:hypothetical protein n=1 Tax=unclassified Flavobacterium TaxID=196869 RepID=UPI00360A34EC